MHQDVAGDRSGAPVGGVLLHDGIATVWIEVWLDVIAQVEYIWALPICSLQRPLRSRFDYKPVDLGSPDGGIEGPLLSKDVTGKREATTTSVLVLYH